MSGTREISDSSITLLTAGDMSANVASSGYDLQGVTAYAIQAVYTGSPVGTLKVQISNDKVSGASEVTTWSDYTGSSLAISAAGDVTYKITRCGERWVRVYYTFTSGTGSLGVILSIQG